MTDDINDQLSDAFGDDQEEFDFGDVKDDIPNEVEKKVAVVSSRQKSLEDAERATIEEAMQMSDLRERAKFLLRSHVLIFPKEVMLKDGSTIPKSDELNRTAFLDAVFDHGNPNYPHPVFDSFSQRIIMHDGREFDDAWLYPIMSAMGACGLDGQSYETLSKSYRSWAIRKERNLLQDRITEKTPEWDGKERAEVSLINLFRCFDLEVTRLVSKQFWLSLYNRAMSPGCLAPICIALIGGQNVGKSYFSQLISRCMIGSVNPPAITLTFKAAEQEKFLRNITGAAVVANVSEFYGFSTGDINLIKSFTTLTTDSFGRKYANEKGVPRQWIVIMDGNDYRGFHRDDTGNRRFYPIFCNQLPNDAKGHPQWVKEKAPRTDFEQGEGFEAEFWQIMAECKKWMDEHGMDGYIDFTNEVSDKVSEFNGGEMKRGSGAISNEHTDTWLPRMLKAANWTYKKPAPKTELFRASVALDHLQQIVKQASGVEFNPKDLKRKMDTLGFERVREAGSYHYVMTIDLFFNRVGEGEAFKERAKNEFVSRMRWWLLNDSPKGDDLKAMPKVDTDEIAVAVSEARSGIRYFIDSRDEGF